jgi:hypothetical protein
VVGSTHAQSSIILHNQAANTQGAYFHIGKSRGTAYEIVNNNDPLGVISFQGADGSTMREGAGIAAFVDGAPGASDLPTRLVFSTTADGASSPTERMRITNGGLIKATTGSQPSRYTNNVDQWRSSGTLGQATTNYSANNANLSDRNAKKDISPAADTWDCIKEWEIVNYRYKDQPDDADLNLGVIAQQVAESCPEVITVFEEAKDDQPEKLGVKEQQMYWMAIKALQEAQVRIEALEAEVTALKAS